MALDGTYETKLIRILIGYFHVSLMQQLAQTEHGKSLRSLTQEEKDALANDVVAAIAEIASSLSESALKETVFPKTVN